MLGLFAGPRASRARLEPPCVRVVLWIAPPSDLFIVNVGGANHSDGRLLMWFW